MLIYRSDLNALVFDYLVVEGFSDAAVEFARETGLPVDVDQASIQERMRIRDAVEDGRVEEAVRRVNELDPEVRRPSVFSRNFGIGARDPKDINHHAPRLARLGAAMLKHLISQT